MYSANGNGVEEGKENPSGAFRWELPVWFEGGRQQSQHPPVRAEQAPGVRDL